MNTAVIRRIKPTLLDDEGNKITVEAKEHDVKETRLKINIEETYEKIIKHLNAIDMKNLRDTLQYLRTIDIYKYDNVQPI